MIRNSGKSLNQNGNAGYNNGNSGNHNGNTGNYNGNSGNNAGNTEIRYSSTSSNGSPDSGLSQAIVNNGEFTNDGKTFSYSWSTSGGDGTSPEINMEEVLALLKQRMARTGSSTCSRCTRNTKFEL